MSAPTIQHSILPENNKGQTGYTEFDNVDFIMTFEGRKLLGNSVRLVGELEVLDNGVRLDNSKKIYYDESIGLHGAVESVQTTFQTLGNVENLTAYPRMVGMIEDGTTNALDMMNSENVCEGKAPIKQMSLLQMIGEFPDISNNKTTDFVENMSFSIKPVFVLNSTQGVGDGDTSVSYKKTGAVRVVFTLARRDNFLSGFDNDSNVTYKLKNLRLEFVSVPEDNKSNQTLHRVKYHIKQSVLSSTTNVSSKVPAVVQGVSASFVRQANENAAVENSYRREEFPLLDTLQFLFNNATNEYIQYKLDDRNEVLMRYIQSLQDTGHNRMSLKNLKGNHSYGVGLSFQGDVDLRNQLFNIVLNSSDTTISTNPFNIHLYFHSAVVV